MSEPRRPPPPKSYVPLDLTTGPPKLPPRPTAAGEALHCFTRSWRWSLSPDAGPPPNYTPPPPPMSDEEDSEDLTRREPASSTPDSHRPPPPPNPQPQTPSTSVCLHSVDVVCVESSLQYVVHSALKRSRVFREMLTELQSVWVDVVSCHARHSSCVHLLCMSPSLCIWQ